MVLSVFFLIPYKIAFLSLFYLPVLTAWRPDREAWDARVAISELRKGVEMGR